MILSKRITEWTKSIDTHVITIQSKEWERKRTNSTGLIVVKFFRCHHILHRCCRCRCRRRLSDMWHVIFSIEFGLCVHGDWVRWGERGVWAALVWQLANLIHAINYVVSLTHGTQAFFERLSASKWMKKKRTTRESGWVSEKETSVKL